MTAAWNDDMPVPDYCHPDLEPYRAAVLHWLDSRPSTVSYLGAAPSRPSAAPPQADEDTTNQISFGMMKFYGYAPFVGRPFHYQWRVAFDGQGRFITGPARAWYWADDRLQLCGYDPYRATVDDVPADDAVNA